MSISWTQEPITAAQWINYYIMTWGYGISVCEDSINTLIQTD